MATRLYFRNLSSSKGTDAYTQDVLRVAGTAGAFKVTTTTAGGTERQLYDVANAQAYAGQSERVAAQVTISGDVTVTIWMKEANASNNASIRVKLWKVTAGGSHVETLIGSAEYAGELSTTLSEVTLTITPAVPVVVAPNERLIVRLYAIPAPGETMGATGSFDDVYFQYNTAVGTEGHSWIELTETVTFLDNRTRLFLAAVGGIDGVIGNFYDFWTTQGVQPFKSGIVKTVAAGTNIQWTRSAGAFGSDITAAAIADTSNLAAYTSPSFTPVAGRLYLLAVVHSDTAPEATVPTISTTTGLTFVQVGSSLPFDTIASNLHRLTLFRALKTSGLSAGTYTVNFLDAGTGCATQLTEITGVLTSGTDGANAIRNISTNSANAGANPSITMGAFAQSYNGVYACFGSDIATVPTPATGFNALGNPDYATPTTGLYAQWSNLNRSTASCTLSSSDWAGIAVELVAATAPVVLEWISPRLKRGFMFAEPAAPSTDPMSTLVVWLSESAADADIRFKSKLWRYRGGVETLVLDGADTAGEITTTPTQYTVPSTLGTVTPTGFLPDDRIVLRVYAHSHTGTMVADRFGRLDYAGDTADVDGDSYLELFAGIELKASWEPDEEPIEGGLMMGGVGN